MSGLEVAGLVLGAVPILIEAAKAYSATATKFRTFLKYSREIGLMSVEFDVQQGMFSNECCLLLRDATGDPRVDQSLLEDGIDKRWTNAELETKLQIRLKGHYKLFRGIMHVTSCLLDDLGRELQKFDFAMESKNSSFKLTKRHIRDALRLSFSKVEYEHTIRKIRDQNSLLSQLRSQLKDFQQQQAHTSNITFRRSPPPRIDAVRKASCDLHDALRRDWRCTDDVHKGHYAQLCLEAKPPPMVRLELAISCHNQRFKELRSCDPLPEPPIWLIAEFCSAEGSCPQAETTGNTQVSHRTTSSIMQNIRKRPADSPQTPDPKPATCNKKKKKKTEAPTIESHTVSQVSAAIASVVSTQTQPQAQAVIDFLQTNNACYCLRQNIRMWGSISTSRYVGHLETPEKCKYEFYYEGSRNVEIIRSHGVTARSFFSVPELMTQAMEEDLRVPDQLSLALKAALAVLQFGETPWLSRHWQLDDLRYYGLPNSFSEDALRSLHLSSQISSPGSDSPAALPTPQTAPNTVCEIPEEVYAGISNSTLFRLGIALLELGHWKPLASLAIEQDRQDPIRTARRLATESSNFGPKYDRLIRRLVQSNFGPDEELGKEELQETVYSDVICQLEEMISGLTI